MNLDFTIAVQPEWTHIDKELRYIKSALLYADKIVLISPMVYVYTQLNTGDAKFDEKRIIKLINFILSLWKEYEPQNYSEVKYVMDEFSRIIHGKQYKGGAHSVQKIKLQEGITKIMQQLDEKLVEMMGQSQTNEIDLLLKSGKIVVQKFEHNLYDTRGCVSEYFGYLTKSIKNSFPIFDEASNDFMKAAMRSKIINLSESEKRKITHAGVSDNLLQRLPSFDSVSVDEIIDIRKELSAPLIRFRSKLISYTENIQSMPWDGDFEYDCSVLYDKEIAPAVLEIDEMTRENSFRKNLFGKFAADRDVLKATGGLLLGLAAANIIPSFIETISANPAVLGTGGVLATVATVAATYQEYQEKQLEISKNDLYFYYKAGKLMEGDI